MNSRWLIVGLSVVYAMLCFASNVEYTTLRWPEYGFSSAGYSLPRVLIAIALTAVVSWWLPASVRTPGDAVIIALSVLVVIPTVAVTSAQASLPESHIFLVIVFSMSFAMVSRINAVRLPPLKGSEAQSRAPLALALLAAWVVITVWLVVVYGQMMRFTGLDDTYEQRELGRSTSTAMAYAQTYYLAVISPGLLAMAMGRGWFRALAAPAMVGFLLVYLITAQKIALALPFIMIGFVMARAMGVARASVALVVASVAVAIGIVAGLNDPTESSIASILLHRVVGIPAMTLTQYYDHFSEFGLTYWSHVKGISWVVEAPAHFAAHPNWPALGYIMGDAVMGRPDVNLNANPFSTDGAAAAGLLGVFLISVVMAAWLLVINTAAESWDMSAAQVVIIPVAVALTNGPFFTVMLSFGGIFWTLVFVTYALFRLRKAYATPPGVEQVSSQPLR